MIGMAKGMITTFKHLFKPTFTIQYPNVKRPLPERSRMSFAKRTRLRQRRHSDSAISSSAVLTPARSSPRILAVSPVVALLDYDLLPSGS